MGKFWRLSCLLLAIACVLTGCKAQEPQDTPPPDVQITLPPTQAPTERGWMPDPTVTPRDFGVYVTPEPEKLAPLIHPIDREALKFDPYTYVEEIGLGYEVPATWERVAVGSSTMTYYEPDTAIQSKEPVPSSIDVSISLTGAAASTKDVENRIQEVLTEMGGQYEHLQYSNMAQQRMKNMKEMGTYVTFWIDVKPDGQEITVTMRGRIHVVPVDRKLILIRYICPADYNTDYEAVYKRLRDSIREL